MNNSDTICCLISQAYEDWLRRKQDKIVNTKICKIVKDGAIVSVQSQSIRVRLSPD